jgi:hypothetical protein
MLLNESLYIQKINTRYGCMARGDHGIATVSLGPAMPYRSTPCRRLPLKWPYGNPRGSRPQGRRLAAVFHPLGHPTLNACDTRGFTRASEPLETCYSSQTLRYEPIHFILTTTWLILGGVIQSSVIFRNIQNQVSPLIRQMLNG